MHRRSVRFVKSCKYVEDMWKRKQYAFVSDVLRMVVLWKKGGIYFDNDVQLLQSLDPIFSMVDEAGADGFCVMDFNGRQINPGLPMMCKNRGNPIVGEMLELYRELPGELDGRCFNLACSFILTSLFMKHGFVENDSIGKVIGGLLILPSDYFNPGNINPFDKNKDMEIEKALNVLEKEPGEVYAIHHYNLSWLPTLYDVMVCAIEEHKFVEILNEKTGVYQSPNWSVEQIKGFYDDLPDEKKNISFEEYLYRYSGGILSA